MIPKSDQPSGQHARGPPAIAPAAVDAGGLQHARGVDDTHEVRRVRRDELVGGLVATDRRTHPAPGSGPCDASAAPERDVGAVGSVCSDDESLHLLIRLKT